MSYKMVFGKTEVKDIYFENIKIVEAREVDLEMHWVLPGGITTTNWDAVRDYCIWVRSNALHIEGVKLIEETKACL